METILKDGMCRCCASEGTFKDFTASYQWMGVEEVYSDMLKDCFDITLSTSLHGNSNGGICEVCVTQLRNAFNFKKQVQHTEEKFKKMQEIVFKPETIKIEMGHDDSEPNSDNMDDDFSGAEYDVPIKYETADDTKPKKRAAKASTSKKKPKTELGETSAKRKKEGSLKIETEYQENETPSDHVYSKTKFNIAEILKCTNATIIRCRGGIGYRCSFCKEEFPDPADLKKHTLEHTEGIDVFSNKILRKIVGREQSKLCVKLDITSLTCNICGSAIASLEDLFQHLVNEHKRTIYTDIKNHIVPFKFDTEQLRCCICSKEYNSFKALLEHMNTHSANYVCNICCATFVNKGKVKVHKLTHVIGEYKCRYCPKILDTIVKKTCHERSAHKNVNEISKCGYCSQKFSSHRRREVHLFEAHGVPLPKVDKVMCKICIREFWSKNALNAHLRRVHLLEKSHKCEFCDMEFFALNELRNHILKHTGERSFKCDVCSKAYGRKTTLREHMRIHENDRRFKCGHCGQAFVQKCSWRGHMRAKHGEDV